MTSRRAFLASASSALAQSARPSFNAPIGLALYSLRHLAQKDLPATLKLASDLGFTDVETGALYNRTPQQFLQLLNQHKLRAISTGASYKELMGDINSVVNRAHALKVQYVVCSTIPHSAKHLTAADCPPAAANLNKWGRTLASAGLSLCYHIHGTEFDPSPDGTQFDTLAKLTDPLYANFEMDIFWVVYGLQDPPQLLRRYPNRFPLMHVKDIKPGITLNLTPADVAEDDSVPLGTGLVNVSEALFAGQQHGVKHFFLEEEAVDAVPQIRQSLRYIASLR